MHICRDVGIIECLVVFARSNAGQCAQWAEAHHTSAHDTSSCVPTAQYTPAHLQAATECQGWQEPCKTQATQASIRQQAISISQFLFHVGVSQSHAHHPHKPKLKMQTKPKTKDQTKPKYTIIPAHPNLVLVTKGVANKRQTFPSASKSPLGIPCASLGIPRPHNLSKRSLISSKHHHHCNYPCGVSSRANMLRNSSSVNCSPAAASSSS